MTSKNLLVVGKGRSMIFTAEISHLLYCFYKPLHHPKPSGKVCYRTFQPWLGFFSDKSSLDSSKYFGTTRQIWIQTSASALFEVSMGRQKILRNKLHIRGSCVCLCVCVCVCVCVLSHLSCIWLFVTLWTVAHQGYRDSPGKNTRLGCHALLQGIFPTQGLKLHLLSLLHWQVGSLPLMPPAKPIRRS